MRLRSICLLTVLASALVLGGCSGGKHDGAHQPAAQAEQQPAPAHAHGSATSKLGLQPAVVDGIAETNDVALIQNGKLVEVDLLNTMGALHGIFAVPQPDVVLITIDRKNVAWSDRQTDYPVQTTIPGPLTRVENRLRMSAEQLNKLVAFYYPNGKAEVKDGKLHIATGR